MDLHHNLFYAYRGSNTDEADRDRQLENNLTKALINTLKLGGESVWRPFLAKLGIAGAPRDFLLQRRDLPGGQQISETAYSWVYPSRRRLGRPARVLKQRTRAFLMLGFMAMGSQSLLKVR